MGTARDDSFILINFDKISYKSLTDPTKKRKGFSVFLILTDLQKSKEFSLVDESLQLGGYDLHVGVTWAARWGCAGGAWVTLRKGRAEVLGIVKTAIGRRLCVIHGHVVIEELRGGSVEATRLEVELHLKIWLAQNRNGKERLMDSLSWCGQKKVRLEERATRRGKCDNAKCVRMDAGWKETYVVEKPIVHSQRVRCGGHFCFGNDVFLGRVRPETYPQTQGSEGGTVKGTSGVKKPTRSWKEAGRQKIVEKSDSCPISDKSPKPSGYSNLGRHSEMFSLASTKGMLRCFHQNTN
ncbi:hypothetical protein KI387_000502, partial [Taxus chinensis]